jgi:hypothetical protein
MVVNGPESEAKKMKLSLILLIVLVSASAFNAVAQAGNGDTELAQSTEQLRLQLLEAEAKESELQNRARQLDEDLKPENIERYFAGVGSTRPEELRELHRRQLSIERERVQAQLKLIATRRERLETAIRFAENQSYQESAEGTAAPLQMLKGNLTAHPRLLGGVVGGLAMILGVGFVIVALVRKANPV